MRISNLPTNPEDIIEFLKALAMEAHDVNPHISMPFLPEITCDLELDWVESDSGESLIPLSFEDDGQTSD